MYEAPYLLKSENRLFDIKKKDNDYLLLPSRDMAEISLKRRKSLTTTIDLACIKIHVDLKFILTLISCSSAMRVEFANE